MVPIAFVLDQEFQDSEFRVPYERLRSAGHDITVIGRRSAEKLEGKRGFETVRADVGAGSVRPDDFDALVIPGGRAPDKLRMQDQVVSLTRRLASHGKPVAAVCHGASLLAEAGVLENRTVTGRPSIRTDLQNAGARRRNRAVVEDGNLIASRWPGDLDAFSDAILRCIRAMEREHVQADHGRTEESR